MNLRRPFAAVRGPKPDPFCAGRPGAGAGRAGRSGGDAVHPEDVTGMAGSAVPGGPPNGAPLRDVPLHHVAETAVPDAPPNGAPGGPVAGAPGGPLPRAPGDGPSRAPGEGASRGTGAQGGPGTGEAAGPVQAAPGAPGDGAQAPGRDGPPGGQGPFEGAVVRRLTAADAVAFRAVWLEALRLHPEVHGTTLADWTRRPLSAYVERMEQGAVFGLFTARGLEGLVAWQRVQAGNARHRAEIAAAYVRAHLRRRGAGRAMLAEALKQAQAEGLVQVAVSVTSADPGGLAFWEDAGFVHYATLPRGYRVEGRYLDAWHLILEIG